MKMFRKEEGFTLVELMVVVLIIGILVAIAIPVFSAAKRNAQTKACWANQRTIDGAVNSYQAEFGVFPAAGAVNAGSDLVTTNYLKVAPIDPGTAATPYVTAAGAQGEVSVSGCPNGGGFDHQPYQ